MIRKISKAIKNPLLCISIFISKISPLIPDKCYIKTQYWLKNKYWLNLKNPKTFNEKLNWLKLNNRKQLYTTLADKYAVKDYVANIIGREYVVPCYGTWSKYEDIDFCSLPCKFVMKLNHDSSGAFICKDKRTLNKKRLKNFINKYINRNYYWHLREWPYRNIKPCIIAEELLIDGTNEVLRDYKFWCFNGVPKFMYCTVKGTTVFENFYDMDFNPVDINHGFPRHKPEFEKPEKFELMKELAAKLSKNIPFVRIDFFYIDGRVYFGEFTFYDWGGFSAFKDYNQDVKLGDLINL